MPFARHHHHNMQQQKQFVTPGTIIGQTDQYIPGPGTYVRSNNDTHRIYASIVGKIQITPSPTTTTSNNSTENSNNKPTIQISPPTNPSTFASTVIVPQISDTVTARVTKITPQLAKVEILVVGDKALDMHTTFSGIIRQQDVRATDIDKVQIATSFRPGDIVKARVISLGDARSYYLSTASNELGVIYATSTVGKAPMIPVSWNEMQCSRTGLREQRKVAKVNV